MLRSLYSAVSGIDVNQKAMDVIGNNIANVNTVGFKQGRAIFQDLLSQTLSGGKAPTDSRGGINPRQVGTGAYLVAVDNIIEQGVIKSTASTTDLAIQGDGFFVLRGEGNTQYYSRAGDFNFDKTGVLTSPSGYRVQGWMADPLTGKVQYNASASDIILTDAYNIMQARATENITYAGVLDSGSTGSTATFKKMLTQATANMSIFNVLPASTGDLGLATNDKVTIQAHATGLTSIDQIYNENGMALGLRNNSNITFDIDGSQMQVKYVTSNANPANGEFTTMDQLTQAINSMLASYNISATATLEMGKIKLTAAATSGSFKVNSITSNSTYLTNIMSPLYGSYTSNTARTSNEFFFRQELKATEDFKSLGDFANAVEGSLMGNVIDNFTVDFMENNFGLQDGDQFTITYTNGIVPSATATFVYRDGANPLGANEFHTLSDLAASMSTALGNEVTVSVQGEGLHFGYASGGVNSLEFLNFSTSRGTLPGPVTTGVSPYLEGTFNSILNQTINSTVRNLTIDEIAGKGRISYNNQSALHDLTGFSITKASSGGLFNDNIIQLTTGVLSQGQSTSSGRFLTTATSDTALLDLFTQTGEPCNFVEDSTVVNFNATIDGTALTAANSFTVAVESTVQDLMAALEEYLGLGKSFNTKQNVVLLDGAIKVYGENGEANNIDALTMTASPASTNSAFNSIGMASLTAASGGRFVSDMTIFDQQGNEHVLKFDFAAYNHEQNEWKLRISTSDIHANVSIDGATTNEIVLAFTPDGKPSYIYDPFTDPKNLLPNPSISFDPGNGTNTIAGINLNLGTSGTNDGLTLSNANIAINTAEQDGYALGALEQKFFNEAGEIIGYYTNGMVRAIAQIGLATFANNRGLLKVGDSLFQSTANSGNAAIGTPQSGFRGSIASSALEQSNVDLASEFVNMIVTQRGFQANSRVVTTSDEMIQELLNLKR